MKNITKPLTLAVRGAILSLATTPALAFDQPFAGGQLQINGSAQVGTVLRTSDRDAEILPGANATEVGETGSAPGGKNQDDGNLNFEKGEPVSTTLKGMLNLRYTRGDFGVVGQVQAWYDAELRDGNRRWGNSTNGYTPNRPLSEHNFTRRSRFSGIALGDLYTFGKNTWGGNTLDWKVGQQRLDWGSKFTISGGLGDLSPKDRPARFRAGAMEDESRVPVPALSALLTLSPTLAIEGFLQTHFEPNVPFGCGTLFSQLDFVAEGCDQVVLGNVNTTSDRASLASGLFIDRADTREPGGLQGGLALFRKLPAIQSEIGVYATQFHSRRSYYGAFKTGRSNAVPFAPGNPDGFNPRYYTEYVEDVRMFGLSFSRKLQHGAILAELTYRPNQPFQYNAADLLQAFLSAAGPTPLRAEVAALPLGARFEGFKRYKAAQLNLGLKHGLPGVLGAKFGFIGMELAYKWADVPSADGTRFGRADVYGQGPVNGACTGSAKTCSTDGYVSRNATGYRLVYGQKYPQLIEGVDFSPTISFGHDVHGWSGDGAIAEGRQFAIVSLKSEIQNSYQVELSYRPIWGGKYNNLKDRDTLMLSVGYSF